MSAIFLFFGLAMRRRLAVLEAEAIKAAAERNLYKAERDVYKKVTKNLYRSIIAASPEKQGTNAILRAFIDAEECEYAKTPKGQCQINPLDYQAARCIVCEARWRMSHPELAPSVKASA